MTDDRPQASQNESADPWSAVALALGRDAEPGDEAEAADGPGGAAPPGWARIAESLRPAPAGVSRQRAPVPVRPAVASSEPAGEAPPSQDRTEVPAATRRGPATRGLRLTRRGRVVAAGLVVVVVAGVGGGLVATRGGGLPAKVALSVDGQNVSRAQFQTNNAILKNFYGIAPPPASDPKAFATFQQTAAKAYAIDLLLDRAATRMKLSVTSQQVDGELNQLVRTAAGVDQAKLNQALAASGLNQQDLRTQIRRQLIEVKVYGQVGGKVSVTPAAEMQTFNANPAALALPETRTINHVVVADQAGAQSVVAQLSQGASFATLAAQDSLDTNSKASGGLLGTLAQAQLSSTFGQAAFSAQPGVPFGPINEGSGGGWDVGLVTAVNPAQPAVNNPTTQGIIRTYLTDQTQNRRWMAWLSGQLTAAHITYASGLKPAQPHAAPQTSSPTLASLVLQQTSSTGPGPTASSPAGSQP